MIAELYTGARATMMSTMYHPQFVAMATALQTDHALLAAAVRFARLVYDDVTLYSLLPEQPYIQLFAALDVTMEVGVLLRMYVRAQLDGQAQHAQLVKIIMIILIIKFFIITLSIIMSRFFNTHFFTPTLAE